MVARIVIAGTASGVGKTTVTVALTRALSARGLRVAVFKCGPDYLDPTYHARAAEMPCHNLDGWMMGSEAVRATFERATRGVDIALIEGVMGLFDGASPTSDEGSTAEVAKWLGAPVLLVCDASGMARSIAALARGFMAFDPDLTVGGLICNRVGSQSHLELLRKAARGSPFVLGGFLKEPVLAFPERHLGLHAATRAALRSSSRWLWLPTRLQIRPPTVRSGSKAMNPRAREWLDLDRIVALARTAPASGAPPDREHAASSPRCRIGVAVDEAFHFYYDANLRHLEACGAELVHFSPLYQPSLPEVQALYFGGGYPELHAERLSANTPMRQAVAAFAQRGAPIYAECGGLMYLAKAIRTLDGGHHPMAAVVPGEVTMHERLRALGYVEVETQARTFFGAAGLRFRGHEFRYSDITLDHQVERTYSVRRRRGADPFAEGYRVGNTIASYVHAHWASNPLAARGLVEAAVVQRGAA